MAIYGVGGKPGTGKTYWCVAHMVKKYFEWDKIHGEYMRRFGVEIVTNIDELRLDHFTLDEMIMKSGKDGKGGTVESFFTVEYQRKLLSRFNRVVYIIDEAGKYFGAGFKERDVLFFFQYHRHLGIDIYLVSSNLEGVSRGLLNLLEYRIVGKERSKRVLNEFRYVKYVGPDKVGVTVLKPERKIFHLYKSMVQDEHEKIPAMTRKVVFFAVACILGAMVLFRYTMSNFGSGNDPGKKGKISRSVGGLKNGKTGSEGLIGRREIKDLGVRADSLVKRDVVSLEDLKRDYVKIVVSRGVGGGPVVYSEDGRYYSRDDIGLVLRDGIRAGGAIWVKRAPSRAVTGTDRADEVGDESRVRPGKVTAGEKMP